jgi:hypothetical protein
MYSRNEENLRDLFEKYMDAEQAQNYAEDIEKGERILHDYHAPEPDDMLIANIKANIALSASSQRKSHVRKIIFEAISVAAAIIIIAAISINQLQNSDIEKTQENLQVASLFPWDNTSADYESMYYEMEQLNDEIFASSSSQDYTDSSRTLIEYAELEMKMEEVNNRSFWEVDNENQFDTLEYETDQEEFISDFLKGKGNEIT